MSKWKLIDTESDLTNPAYHFVTYHVTYDDGTVMEIRYRMPFPATFHDDYRDMVVSRRRVRYKGRAVSEAWKEGNLKRRRSKAPNSRQPKTGYF